MPWAWGHVQRLIPLQPDFPACEHESTVVGMQGLCVVLSAMSSTISQIAQKMQPVSVIDGMQGL